MKKTVLLVFSVGVLLVLAGSLAGAGTLALFSDSETASIQGIQAGELDLKVNGKDSPVKVNFNEKNMKPGQAYNLGKVTVKNAGTIDGNLSLKVANPVSKENGLAEPEKDAGDVSGTEVDLTGYDANAGNGELWDQCALTIYVDMNKDGKMQWNEPVVYSGPMGLDMTGYSPLNANLFSPNHGFDGTISPGEKVDIGFKVKFFDDQQPPMISQPQYNGMTNNQAMTDTIEFDAIFGLQQA